MSGEAPRTIVVMPTVVALARTFSVARQALWQEPSNERLQSNLNKAARELAHSIYAEILT